LPFPFYSLRTGILAHLAFLLVSAMLLINVIMLKFAERDLIQAKLQRGRLLLHAMEQRVGYEFAKRDDTWVSLGSDPVFSRVITHLLQVSGFSAAVMVNDGGINLFATGLWDGEEKEALSICRETLATRKVSFRYRGSTWGVIWLAHKGVHMSSPMTFEGRLMGAAAIYAPLGSIYQSLRESEKIILFYVLLNTIVLVLVGMYLLSRTVVKPIHKLLQITEEFQGDEPIPPLPESYRNEIGQLFRSLQMMLHRLEENKKALKDHITSLEKANEEIRKAQDEIIKSEKLASIGRLATGIAHEIGNPIGIILGYLGLLKGKDLKEEEKEDFLERIESEITRVSQIIQQLLNFSRPADGEKQQVRVHELIEDVVEMLKPQPMMSDIETELVFDATRDEVCTDPNQLKQVFLNIILNSADAMAESEDSAATLTGKELTIQSTNFENSIELRFTDTGPGIPKEALGQIFDPFYTTKEPGKGTGLGLSVSYRIIEGLGGTIFAESTPGEGTTIVIRIPLLLK